MMTILRGRRHAVVAWTDTGIWLEPVVSEDPSANRVRVAPADPDLILEPSGEDLHIADAYERGEINAFEYADGRTYPPGREVVPPRRSRMIDSTRRH